jgi:hypothetical protein
MAKKKKDDGGSTKRKSSGNGKAWAVASAAGGAAVGAIGGALAARGGIEPKTAAIAVTVVGAAGALATSGNVRWAATGALGAGASQLALAWLQKKTEEGAAKAAAAIGAGSNQPRQGLPGDVAQAFRDAREQMQDDYAN